MVNVFNLWWVKYQKILGAGNEKLCYTHCPSFLTHKNYKYLKIIPFLNFDLLVYKDVQRCTKNEINLNL